jgi:CRP-like cAMP-binding protein
VFAPTAHPHSVYLLETGRVRIYRVSESGTETTLGYVQPGEVFGEFAALGDYPRESYAEAAERCLVWKIPREHFQPLVESRPDLGTAISKQIGTRLKRIESRVEDLVFRDAHTRVVIALLELGDRFGHDDGAGRIRIGVQITQAELATLVGATRQTVNASLKELSRVGLLKRDRRRLVLTEPDKLREALRIARGA